MIEKKDFGFRFRDWDIYKDARIFRRDTNKLLKTYPSAEQFALIDQTKRALNSIILAIAEGANKNSDRDTRVYINRAQTSLDEVVACLDCALDDNYISPMQHDEKLTQAASLAKRLNAFNTRLGGQQSSSKINDQKGQTLIETLLATFILTTSLVAGLSVAIYALTSSAVSKNQVIAINLSREGIEVVRMMRDSNWLAAEPDPAQADPDVTDDLQSCPDLGGDFCYPKAFASPSYNLNPGGYRAVYNSATRAWSLQLGPSYDLFVQADGQYAHVSAGTSDFARQIQITNNTAVPYTAQNPEVHVKSAVLWRGKNCTEFDGNGDLFAVTTPCKVVIEEHLTNWKDYK